MILRKALQGGLLGGSGWSGSTLICGRSPEVIQGGGKAILQRQLAGIKVKSGFRSSSVLSSSETLAWDPGFASVSNMHPPDAYKSLQVGGKTP